MIRVWTYLKNTDLHAMSAYETLSGVMGVSFLRRLRRFQLFEFTEALPIVMQKIEGGFSVLNPTKEGYYLDRLPQVVLRDDEQVMVCQIQSGQAGRSIVWEMVVSKDVTQAQVWEQIVVSSSRVKGLLANPIYETALFLDSANVFG